MKLLSVESLHELQILSSKTDDKSLLTLLNRAQTYQGKDKIRVLLSTPLHNVEQIEQRHQLIRFVSMHLDQFNIDLSQGYLTAAYNHLASNLIWSNSKSIIIRYKQAQWLRWFRPYDYSQLESGTAALQLCLQIVEKQTTWWRKLDQLPRELHLLAQQLKSSFEVISSVLYKRPKRTNILEIDYLLRCKHADEVQALFDVFYQLDAYCGITRFLATQNWVYPDFIKGEKPTFRADNIEHPLLDKQVAVGNNFSFTYPTKLTILTGGNMSGKTTFLKTCGLIVYLAHIGLPVPARSMQLSFFDCLLTSIHLSDNLSLGYSHFYTELIRIKEVAETISEGKRVFFIVDELFRGTNPEDSLLCGRQVIEKLLKQEGSLYMISTHLPELGTFYQSNTQVQFNCFKTKVVNSKLFFSYKLEVGKISERTGMLLLEQTGVLTSLK